MSLMTEGLFEGTDYPDFELIVVDNGSTDPDTLALYERLKRERPNFTLDLEPAPFNFSRAGQSRRARWRRARRSCCSTTTSRSIEPGWLSEMVGCLAYAQAGIVGARLALSRRRYPARRRGGRARRARGALVQPPPGRFPRADGAARRALEHDAPSPAPACSISRACLDAVGPFDEENFAVAYNDVDFCLRARAAGFRTIYTPFATLIHHESATRGRDDRGPNRPRFLRDQAALLGACTGRTGFSTPCSAPGATARAPSPRASRWTGCRRRGEK